MDRLTTPEGALGLAVVALLVVLGYRLARPERGPDWIVLAAYAGALATIYGGARAVPARDPGLVLRLTGAAALLAGVVLAGTAMRARRRDPAARAGLAPIARAERPRIHAGLALVVAGQLLRAPTLLGLVAAAVAGAALAWGAWRVREARAP